MKGYLTDSAGAVWALPTLLSWDVKHGLGEPCDAFEVSFAYAKELLPLLYGAVRFRGEYGGETVFRGVVDEYEVTADGTGLTAAVRGRGLAALLLDNQCEAAQYAGVGLDYIVRHHVTPWGVHDVKTGAMAALGDFTVTSGDSQWSVLKRFCRFAGGVRPRFTPDGVLLLNGQDGAARAIGPGTAVTAAVIRDSRYGVISEVLVKNKARGSAETVKNAAYLARGVSCRRVLAVPRRTGGDAMRYTAQYQIEESERGKRTVELTLPAQFAAFAGDRVSLTAPALGLSGDYRVYESRCWADENGAGTALTLEERGTGHVAE